MAVYKRLKDLREDADKTQTDIAEYLGTTAQYYGKYEKGEREIPFARAIQLADYYGVSLDYIAERNFIPKSNVSDINDGERNLIKLWRCLTERNKGKIEYHIERLLDEQNKL